MANSDNVLRGGLTNKYIDVPELMKHVIFEGVDPFIIHGEKLDSETIYPCPAPDFVISKITLREGVNYSHRSVSPEILLTTSGQAEISGMGKRMNLARGEAAFVPIQEEYIIYGSEPAEIFKAAVP
jgi:mannose-6-phosphate isomerase